MTENDVINEIKTFLETHTTNTVNENAGMLYIGPKDSLDNIDAHTQIWVQKVSEKNFFRVYLKNMVEDKKKSLTIFYDHNKNLIFIQERTWEQ